MYKKPEIKKVVDIKNMMSNNSTIADAWAKGWSKTGTWKKG